METPSTPAAKASSTEEVPPSPMQMVQTMADTLKERALESPLGKSQLLSVIEMKTNIPKHFIVWGVIVVLLLNLVLGWGAGIFCYVAGFLYPCYASIAALRTKETNDNDSWLIYWIVYGLFCVVEGIIDLLISCWLPFYYPAKVMFLVGLYHRKTQWAKMIFNAAILPAFVTVETNATKFLNDLSAAPAKQPTAHNDFYDNGGVQENKTDDTTSTTKPTINETVVDYNLQVNPTGPVQAKKED